MSSFSDIKQMFSEMNQEVIPLYNRSIESWKETEIWVENLEIEVMKRVRAFDQYKHKPLLPKPPTAKPKSGKRPALTSSSEEEVSKNVPGPAEYEGFLKPKRNASRVASHKINEQSHLKLNTKMRRPKNADKENHPSYIDISLTSIIKTEKDADNTENISASTKSALVDATNDMMPPPTSKPSKRVRKKIKKEYESDRESPTRVRVTRSTVKQEKIDRESSPNRMDQEPTTVRKTTRTTKQQKTKKRLDSDIVIQEQTISVVVVSDSDTEENPETTEDNIVRTAEIVKEVVAEVEPVITKSKKTKKRTKKPTTPKMKTEYHQNSKIADTTQTTTDRRESVYEDAISEGKYLHAPLKPTLNSTVTLSGNSEEPETCKNKGLAMNCTVVLEKINETVLIQSAPEQQNSLNKTVTLSTNGGPHREIAVVAQTLDNILTDDESFDDRADKENNTEPQLPKKLEHKEVEAKQTKKTKPMFSPYESSPVRKRVAAFEKLGTTEIPATTARVTRTKTRNLLAEKEKATATIQELPKPPARPKFFTPTFTNKMQTLIPHTDGRLHHNQISSSNRPNNNTLLSEASVRCLTTVKPSRTELQERKEAVQRRRMEKEEEVKRKKEALLQAKTEEQRRKREEKQLKAQKVRENKEREKEEKLRQMLQEKEDKQQEEMLRRRELALKKAAEEKRKFDEHLKLAAKLKEQEAKKQEEARRLAEEQPDTYKPVPLPTDDNDDSDDSSAEGKPRPVGPPWGERRKIIPKLLAHKYVPKHFVETLFQMKATTPDLQMLFDGIADHKLRRNSSAIWRTPPRYSQLTKF